MIDECSVVLDQNDHLQFHEKVKGMQYTQKGFQKDFRAQCVMLMFQDLNLQQYGNFGSP